MKLKPVALLISGIMAFSAAGCEYIPVAQNTALSGNTVAIANPWRDCTEEEAYQYTPNGFSAPDGATKESWSICEAADDKELPGTMVQLTFDYDGLAYTARQQPVPGEEITDISGLYYEWTAEEEGTLSNWGGGKMPCKLCRYVGKESTVDLCLWFDIETGYAYSLSTEAPDLDGFDIQAVVEEMYDPSKQIGANAPSTEALEEISRGFIESAAEEIAPGLDVTGCATFTQMIDKVLTEGMGYANEKIGETDVFFVSSGTYDNLDGKDAAIDAALFIYKDGVDTPYEIGKVVSGGTASPLTISNGFLYTASHHWICKYTVADDTLCLAEKAAVVYDSNGNETYYYESDDAKDGTNMTSEEAEIKFNTLFDEMMKGEVIGFSTVG